MPGLVVVQCLPTNPATFGSFPGYIPLNSETCLNRICLA